MTLVQMKYFQAVCLYGSVTQAAIKLHISQPAVSTALKDLEQEFGVHLFIKDNRRSYQLTKAGEIFKSFCERTLSDVDHVSRIMQDISQQYQQVRLGITPMLAPLFMPHLYAKFKAYYPEDVLYIEEAEIQSLIERLDQKDLDIIVLRALPNFDAKYKRLSIANLEYAFCTSHTHRLAGKENVSPEDVANEPLACFSQEHAPFSLPEDFYERCGLQANVAYRTNQASTILSMIHSGTMSGFTYRILENQYPTLSFSSLCPPNYQEIALYWRKDNYILNNTQKVVRCFQELKKEKVFEGK